MTPTPARQPQRELLWEPYWLTPPDVYQKLNAEFHFDFDPCPFPKPDGYNGLNIEWGKSNYVNPPYHREDGIGPTAFARKAVVEHQKGKTVVLTLPVPSYVNFLLEAGAEMRSLGRVRWLHTVTREPTKQPSPIAAFVLSATHTSPPAPVCDAKVCRSVINAHREEAATEAAKAARERVLDEVREALSHIRYQEEDMWFIEAAIKKIESLRAQQEPQP